MLRWRAGAARALLSMRDHVVPRDDDASLLANVLDFFEVLAHLVRRKNHHDRRMLALVLLAAGEL